MPDIRHRVGIAAPIDVVFDSFATTDGLEKFWTQRIEGGSRKGEQLRFYFVGDTPRVIMEVEEIVDEHLVRWRCIAGPDEWVDTTLAFEIGQDGDETTVTFTHADWKVAGAFMHHCSTKWAYFLLGLKNMLEGGTSVAYPNDMPISKWG